MSQQQFSIGWPPRFQSRTTDKRDPCYVGKLGREDLRSHPPTEESIRGFAATEHLQLPVEIPKCDLPRYRFLEGSHAHRAYMALLAADGPLSHRALADEIGQPSCQLWGVLQRPIMCGVIQKHTEGKAVWYTIGAVLPA